MIEKMIGKTDVVFWKSTIDKVGNGRDRSLQFQSQSQVYSDLW